MDYISKLIASVALCNSPASFTLPRYSQLCMENPVPLLKYKMAMPSNRIGNFLGFYFEALACADLSHINFKATYDPELNAKFSDGKHRKDDEMNLFVSSLVNTRKRPALSSANEKLSFEHRLKKFCLCTAYCHEYQSSAWHHRIDLLSSVLSRAITEVLSYTYNISVDLLVNNNGKEGLRSLNFSTNLPLIPDTTIQVRCSDILYLTNMAPNMYGFLPFKAYLNLIPPKSKYIYVISDAKYTALSKEASDCPKILDSLLSFLKSAFPKAKAIILLKGGSIFTSMAQIMYSNVTVCSSSTFCLWPAVASKTSVYFPVSRLVLNGSASPLSHHFHWIDQPRIIVPSSASGEMESISRFIQRLSE